MKRQPAFLIPFCYSTMRLHGALISPVSFEGIRQDEVGVLETFLYISKVPVNASVDVVLVAVENYWGSLFHRFHGVEYSGEFLVLDFNGGQRPLTRSFVNSCYCRYLVTYMTYFFLGKNMFIVSCRTDAVHCVCHVLSCQDGFYSGNSCCLFGINADYLCVREGAGKYFTI